MLSYLAGTPKISGIRVEILCGNICARPEKAHNGKSGKMIGPDEIRADLENQECL
jgi:hypothetical protein